MTMKQTIDLTLIVTFISTGIFFLWSAYKSKKWLKTYSGHKELLGDLYDIIHSSIKGEAACGIVLILVTIILVVLRIAA